MRPLVIFAKPPTGVVEQFGAGLGRGIVPEGYTSTHDEHGPLSAAFTLRRTTSVQWPDLSAGTPVWCVVNGLEDFSGRIAETPTRVGAGDDQISVSCEGWQGNLSDDAAQRSYVNADMASWRDVRSVPAAPLATWTTSANVDAGKGSALITAVNGSAQGPAVQQGVVLDMGPDATNKAARVVLTYEHSATPSANANWSLTVRVTDNADLTGGVSTTVTLPAGSAPSISYTPATSGRYVVVFIARSGGAATITADVWVRLLSCLVATKTAYESGGSPNLKASDVIADALTLAPSISQDTSGITPTSFVIPHLVAQRDAPRALIEQANAYHLYQWMVRPGSSPGDKPRFVFRPVPTMPTLIAPVGLGVQFADASRNALADLFNAVDVEYTDPWGNPAVVRRNTTEGALPAVWLPAASQPTNQDFETGTVGTAAAGWNGAVPGLGAFGTVNIAAGGDGSAQAGQLVADGIGVFQQGSTAMVVRPGARYRLTFRIQRLAAWAAGTQIDTYCLDTTDTTTAKIFTGTTALVGSGFTVGTWTTVQFDFNGPATGVAVFRLNGPSIGTLTASTAFALIDNVRLSESRPTLLDRLGFTRRRVLATGARLTAAAATQIGDAFLKLHAVTPLRGTLNVQGAAVLDAQTSRPVPPNELGRRIGDGILVAGNETDPATGSVGRYGIVSGVTYDAAADAAQIELQNSIDFVDAILQRFALYQS